MSDENICFVDGVEYHAVEINCRGCAAEHDGALCDKLPNCGDSVRNDMTDVIWVKKEK